MIVTIEIANWDKYNPKRDQKTYSWFRLNNDAWNHQSLFGMTPERRFVWVVLLSIASKNNSPTIQVDSEYVAHTLCIKPESVLSAIDAICSRQLATERGRDHDNVRHRTTPTYERTNDTYERTILPEPVGSRDRASKALVPDLESIYRRYPRKEGKARGLTILRGSVKTKSDEIECNTALDRFLDHHRRAGTEADFIPHFKTWAGSWRECLDADYGKAEGFSGDGMPDLSHIDWKPDGVA